MHGYRYIHTHEVIYIYIYIYIYTLRHLLYYGYCHLEMNETRVKIIDEILCISHSTNALGKGMSPITLPEVMGK